MSVKCQNPSHSHPGLWCVLLYCIIVQFLTEEDQKGSLSCKKSSVFPETATEKKPMKKWVVMVWAVTALAEMTKKERESPTGKSSDEDSKAQTWLCNWQMITINTPQQQALSTEDIKYLIKRISPVKPLREKTSFVTDTDHTRSVNVKTNQEQNQSVCWAQWMYMNLSCCRNDN